MVLVFRHLLKETATSRSVKLRALLIVPFVLQMVGIVGFVVYLSYRNSKASVEDLAHQLMDATSDRINLYLDHTLETPHLVNRINADAIRLGSIPGFDTTDTTTLENYFLSQIQQFPSVSTIAIANEQGGLVGSMYSLQAQAYYTYRTEQFVRGRYLSSTFDEKGNVFQDKVLAEDYDARLRPWYQTPKQAGRATWSSIYEYVASRTSLGISAGLPLYDSSKQLQGVLATDVTLDSLNYFLAKLEISPSSQVFIIERSGLLVASSSQEPLLATQQGEVQRISAIDSKNPIIRETVAQFGQGVTSLVQTEDSQHFEFKQAGSRYFALVKAYRDVFGLDWLVITVVPESDLTAQIYANVWYSAKICVAALVGTIALGILIARKISKPILALYEATQAFEDGKVPAQIPPTRIYEVESLRRAFSDMVMGVREVEHLRLTYTSQLEKQVAEKTADLTEAQRIAQVGSWEFDSVTQQMTWSAELFRIAGMNASQALPSFDEMFAMAPLPERDQLKAAVERAIAYGIPYEVEHRILRPEGTIRYAISRGEAIYNDQGQVIKLVGTASDITERKQAEQALRQSEERWALAIEGSNDGIWDHDLITNQHFLSPRCTDILGYDYEEIASFDQLFSYIHPDDQPILRQKFQAYIDRKTPAYTCEYRMRCKDGTYKWVLARGKALWNEAGIAIRAVGSLTDITRRKQAELALRASESKFSTIFQANPAPACIVRLADGSCLDVNPSFSKFYGLSVADIIGKTLAELNIWANKADFEVFLQTLLAQGHIDNYEVAFRTHAQELRTVLVSATMSQINGQDCMVGIINDITERKLAELALKRSQTELQIITDSVPGCISYVDASQRYRFVNRTYEEWLGCRKDEILGRTVAEVIGANAYCLARRYIERVLSGERVPYELALPYLDGDPRYVSGVLVPDVDEHGMVCGYYALITDISDRIQAELALRASDERFQEIAATISQLFFVRSATTGEFLYVSPAYEHIFGRRVESVYRHSQSWMEAIHPDDRPLVTQSVAMQFEGVSVQREYRIVRPNGDIRWVSAQIDLIRDDDGEPLRFIGFAEDITDRKEVELALKQSETRFVDISESSPAHIYIMVRQIDGAFYFEHCSKAIEAIYEIPVDLIMADANILIDCIHPDDRASYIAAAQHSIDTLQPFQHEWRVINPSGSVKWLQGSSRPRRRDNGDVAWYGVVIDITDRKEIEEKLRRSEAALAEAQRVAHVGNWEFDVQSRKMTWSDELFRMFGLDPSQPDPDYESYLKRMHPEDRPQIERAIGRAIAYGIPYTTEYRTILPDGSLRYHEGRTEIECNSAGKVVRLYGVALDITDRKHAEELLRQSETRYRAILEDQTDLIKRFRADGTVVFVNDAFCRYYGLSREYVLKHGYTPPIHPDDLLIVEQGIASLSPDQPVFTVENRVIINGDVRWMQWVNRAIYDSAGHLIELQAVGRDIHDRKQAELALERTTQELQAFLDNAPSAISLFDAEGRYLRINPTIAQLFNRPESEIVGKTFAELLPPEVVRLFETRMQRLAETSYPLEVEDEMIIGGHHRIFQSTLFPVVKENGESKAPETFWAIATDITERKRIERALQKKTEELDRFFTVALDMLCIANTDGSFLRVNKEWERTLGYSAEELEGSRLFDYVHPDDMNDTRVALAALKAQRPLHNFVNRYRCRNGDYRWLEWRSVSVGHLVYAAARDITDRKEAELLLRESEETLATVFHSNPAPAWIAHLIDGRCLEANEAFCEFYGAPIDELVGKTYMELGIWDNLGDFQAFRQILYTTRRLPTYEVVWRTRSGHTKTVLISASVSWLNGKDCVIGVLRDMSSHQETESQLHQKLTEKDIALHEAYQQLHESLQLIQTILDIQHHHLDHPEAIAMVQNTSHRVMAFSLVYEWLYQPDHLLHIDLADYIPSIVQRLVEAYGADASAVAIQTNVQSVNILRRQAVLCGLILNELVLNALTHAFPNGQGTTGKPAQMCVEVSVDETQPRAIIHLMIRGNGIGLPSPCDRSGCNTPSMRIVQDLVHRLRGSVSLKSTEGMQIFITFPTFKSD